MRTLRSDVLEGEARRLTGAPVRVVAEELDPGIGGKATHDGRSFVIRLSPDLFDDVPRLAHAFYHEVGHIVLKHVGPPDGLNTNPPPIVRAFWAAKAQGCEQEADAYARARWAEMGEHASIIFSALAFEQER